MVNRAIGAASATVAYKRDARRVGGEQIASDVVQAQRRQRVSAMPTGGDVHGTVAAQ
jgi:hypothetical protein